MSRPLRPDLAAHRTSFADHRMTLAAPRRRVRIWITRRGANRRGVRPGWAWASLTLVQHSDGRCRWVADAVSLRGLYIGSSMAPGSWRHAP